jgi:hypothetical protein
MGRVNPVMSNILGIGACSRETMFAGKKYLHFLKFMYNL